MLAPLWFEGRTDEKPARRAPPRLVYYERQGHHPLTRPPGLRRPFYNRRAGNGDYYFGISKTDEKQAKSYSCEDHSLVDNRRQSTCPIADEQLGVAAVDAKPRCLGCSYTGFQRGWWVP